LFHYSSYFLELFSVANPLKINMDPAGIKAQ